MTAPPRRPLRYRILLVVSEAAPWAKTGGLGDVGGALADALARLGHEVTLVMPRYRGLTVAAPATDRFEIRLGQHTFPFEVFDAVTASGATVRFLDCAPLFDREGLYGIGPDDYPDNARRFGAFALAVLEAEGRAGTPPAIVHSHDWQGGLVAVYLRTRYAGHPILGRAATVFTLHNLAFQGLFGPEWLPELDLGWALFHPEALEYWGRLSFLKGGINFSDWLTTVSRRYAKEILTPEFGFGFEGVLARRRERLTGIRNGIDTALWDPERDPYLPAAFGPSRLEGKLQAKQEALRLFGFAVDEAALRRPLVAMISRLVDQKGHDLLMALADELPRLDAAVAVLGTGEPRYEAFWRSMADAHPGRIGVRIAFDERLAHLLEAGADIFLMPSRFEPCGLNQMYSLRYGTVPLVHATGGLDDTVRNATPRGTGNGFSFREYSPAALRRTLDRALRLYRTDPAAWQRLQQAGMAGDYSWDASAREYVKVYGRAVRAVGPRGA